MTNPTNRAQRTAARVMQTSRWIHSNQLKVGMYVRELTCPWEDTNFVSQGFVVNTLNQLHDVQLASEYVCIESEGIARASA